MNIFSNTKIFPTGNPNCFMAVNTFNKKACLLSRDMAQLLAEGNFPRLESIKKNLLEHLLEIGIVTAGEDNSLEILEELRENQQTITSHNVTFALTFACNLACPYCLQSEIDRNAGNIDYFNAAEEFNKVIDFLDAHIIEPRLNAPLNLHWYGGEPLLKAECIKFIFDQMRKKYADHEISGTITTNGTLVNSDNIEILKDANTIVAQVTVDGPEEMHNKIRATKIGQKPTYALILANIEKLSEHMKVVVRYNWSMHHGLEPISAFYESMLRYFKDNPRLEFYIIPTAPNSISCGSFFNLSNSREQAKLLRDFINTDIDARQALGLPVKGMGYDVFNCNANKDGNIVISYNGDLYLCVSSVGKKEACVGNIASGFNGKQKVFKEKLPIDEECLKCEFLLTCGGGCRYHAAVDNKDIHSKHCNKKRSEITLRENYLKIFEKEIEEF
jgi:uncharacterized protein